MHRPWLIGVSLILVAVATGGGCRRREQADAPGGETRTEPAITPEQARAALLKLDSLRVITGGEDDPIAVDLRRGAMARIDGSSVTIGRYFSCNLTEKTWQMAVENGRAGRAHFAAGANGRFEWQSDGTWRAITMDRSIT